jgi:hypothetical protein
MPAKALRTRNFEVIALARPLHSGEDPSASADNASEALLKVRLC